MYLRIVKRIVRFSFSSTLLHLAYNFYVLLQFDLLLVPVFTWLVRFAHWIVVLCQSCFRSSAVPLSHRTSTFQSRQPSNSRAAAQQRPFYQMPEDKPTPVQIVNESRQWLRTVPTKRPFTPREEQRTLFGVRPAESRPPSAFSLGGARHFDPASDIASSAGSRPPSGSVRLIPLDHVSPDRARSLVGFACSWFSA